MRQILMTSCLLLLAGCADTGSDSNPTASEEPSRDRVGGKADTEKLCSNDDLVCDWFCDYDPLCETYPLGDLPRASGPDTKYPIMLHHGFNAAPGSIWGYNKVRDDLEEMGHAVYEVTVPPFNSAAVRAEYLAEQVDKALDETGASKVHIIAHSMGGIDARFLINQIGYGDRIASLTTMGSPLRGTPVADLALDILGRADWAAEAVRLDLEAALNAIATLVGRQYSTLADDTDLISALIDLSVAANNPKPEEDDPRVFFQSWAGVSSIIGSNYDQDDYIACNGLVIRRNDDDRDSTDLLLKPTGALVSDQPSDGLVPVSSAVWGNFRGCLPADHLGIVGQPNEYTTIETGFSHIAFYRHLAEELASFENCIPKAGCLIDDPECQVTVKCDGVGTWGSACTCDVK